MLGFCGVRVLGLGGTWGAWDVMLWYCAPGVLGFLYPGLVQSGPAPTVCFFYETNAYLKIELVRTRGFRLFN